MAFVTNFTFEKLVGRIRLDDLKERWTKDAFEDKVYDKFNLFYWFNNLERNRLYIYRYLLESKGSLPAFNIVEEEPDNGIYVFMVGGKLKYHLYPNCNSFKDTYFYYKIPPEIRDEKQELKSVFRGWFKTRKFRELFECGKINDNDILKLYNEVFAKTHSLKEIIDFEFIEESGSSGIEYTQYNFNLKTFNEKLVQLSEVRSNLCNNSKSMFSISRLDYLRDKPENEVYTVFKEAAKNTDAFTEEFIDNYGIDRLRVFWIEHYYIKSKAEKLLKEYFKWTYNFDEISFEEINLENLGLECCKICESRQPF